MYRPAWDWLNSKLKGYGHTVGRRCCDSEEIKGFIGATEKEDPKGFISRLFHIV